MLLQAAPKQLAAPRGLHQLRIDDDTLQRILAIDGYARIDLRMTPDQRMYFIEANPNPMLASDEDFAQSALKAGLAYPQLVDRIIRTALKTVRD